MLANVRARAKTFHVIVFFEHPPQDQVRKFRQKRFFVLKFFVRCDLTKNWGTKNSLLGVAVFDSTLPVFFGG